MIRVSSHMLFHAQKIEIEIMRGMLRKKYNITHILLIIGQGMARLPCREIYTHCLLVIGKGMMGLPF